MSETDFFKLAPEPLESKIRESVAFIRQILRDYTNPVVYSSFGKDSMVLLGLVRMTGVKLPILFHKEPFSPLKYSFANRVIEAFEYEVHDYPPLYTRMSEGVNGDVEVINFYQCGNQAVYLPTGIKAPVDGKPYLCGFQDLYHKSCGSYNYQWDIGLIGHKSTDRDPILGAIQITTWLHRNQDSADFAFPIKNFTDEDVWEFHKIYGLPVNHARYDRDNGWREREDITFNPDYFYACTACLTSDKEVMCPKLGRMVPSAEALKVNQHLPSYVDSEFFPKEES